MATIPVSGGISSPYQITGPGTYIVLNAGATVVLPAWRLFAPPVMKIIVKDGTGSGSPNITVNPVVTNGIVTGTIDGSTAPYVIINPKESIACEPGTIGNDWYLT